MTTFTITPAAHRFMSRVVRFSGHGPGAGFRLSVSPGGCSGMNAEFEAEAEPRVGDKPFVVDGLTLFLPAESRLLLDGVTIDFIDTPTQTGLTFFDPKASGCGCSTSSEEGIKGGDGEELAKLH